MRGTFLVVVLAIGLAASSAWGQPAATEDSFSQAVGLFQRQDHAGAAAMLERIVLRDPQDARSWVWLGLARHANGEYDAALAAHARAATFAATRVQALYNTACTHAVQGDADAAFDFLGKVRRSRQWDMSSLPLDQDLAGLAHDPRFAALLPSPEEFLEPFVEPVTVLHEWRGEGAQDQFGWIARNLGDVDGDRVADVITSAPTWPTGGDQRGRLYAYSGRTGALLWIVTGAPGDQLGLGVEAAGDVNADGVPDAIGGAPGGNRALVCSGDDGRILLELKAPQQGENFGRKVSDFGDLDGDGHHDVIVGAPLNDAAGEDAGRLYVFSGRDGAVLWTLDGERAGDKFGSAGAGVVGGGRFLLVVGAPDAGENQGGRAYVYTRQGDEPAFVIEPDETASQLGGMFVSVVGDIDKDGALDVYASDWSNNAKGRSTGRVYVHSGRTGERLYTFTGERAGDGFGIGPADAGDVDGDGHADLIVGAWQQGNAAPAGGKCYLYSGRDGSLLNEYTCRVPGDTFGFDATGMGDVNGDGVVDLLITSAWSGVAGAHSGRMFVVSSRVEPAHPKPQYRLTRDMTHNKFSRSIPPVLTVSAGSVIEFETEEATDGQLKPNSSSSDMTTLDFDRIHPLTGPVYVEDAHPGDVLAVTLHEIEIGDWGWAGIAPGFGFLADEFEQPALRTFALGPGARTVDFNESVTLPLRPFPGVMGVAPATDELLSTIPPRANGGNLDDPHLVAGTTVYLPVQVEGALFSMGDAHALQGQGEVCGTGIEAPMRIVAQLDIVRPGRTLEEPQYENDEVYAVTAFGVSLDEAARKATRYMIDYLVAEHGLSREDAYVLCSLAADLKVAQVVDVPHVLVTMHISKEVLGI